MTAFVGAVVRLPWAGVQAVSSPGISPASKVTGTVKFALWPVSPSRHDMFTMVVVLSTRLFRVPQLVESGCLPNEWLGGLEAWRLGGVEAWSLA